MEASDFEKILAKELLKSHREAENREKDAYECIDPSYVRAQVFHTRLTTRLKSRAFTNTTGNPYSNSHDQSSPRNESANPTTKHSEKPDQEIEISFSTDQLPMLERIYLKDFIKLGASDRLFVSLRLSTLKSEFRRLAVTYHPDHGGQSEDFQALKEAYDCLESWILGQT